MKWVTKGRGVNNFQCFSADNVLTSVSVQTAESIILLQLYAEIKAQSDEGINCMVQSVFRLDMTARLLAWHIHSVFFICVIPPTLYSLTPPTHLFFSCLHANYNSHDNYLGIMIHAGRWRTKPFIITVIVVHTMCNQGKEKKVWPRSIWRMCQKLQYKSLQIVCVFFKLVPHFPWKLPWDESFATLPPHLAENVTIPTLSPLIMVLLRLALIWEVLFVNVALLGDRVLEGRQQKRAISNDWLIFCRVFRIPSINAPWQMCHIRFLLCDDKMALCCKQGRRKNYQERRSQHLYIMEIKQS